LQCQIDLGQSSDGDIMKISNDVVAAVVVTFAFMAVGAASAADLPVYTKAPVAIAAADYNWTG
jgi:hypothetical protein